MRKVNQTAKVAYSVVRFEGVLLTLRPLPTTGRGLPVLGPDPSRVGRST